MGPLSVNLDCSVDLTLASCTLAHCWYNDTKLLASVSTDYPQVSQLLASTDSCFISAAGWWKYC